jgi:hypothetical protein
MALSLAACGSSSDDTAATDTPAAETPAEETETPAAETPAEETPAEEEVVEEVTPVATELTVSSLPGASTLLATSDLDGGAGTADELSLTLSADFAGFTVAATATDTGSAVGYEIISLAADDLARSFDATGVSGVETYKIDGSNGGVVSIADSADLAAIELSNIASGAFSITYAAPTGGTSPVAGSADTLDLTVEGLGSATADIAITAAGVETLAVTSNAAASAAGATNYLDTSSVGAAAITVAGAADTDFGAVASATTSFDASAATGAVTANLSGAAANAITSIKTGSGDDAVTVDANDLAATGSVDLGTGADKLVMSSVDADVLELTMAGVETLDITDLGNTTTLSMSNTTGLETIQLGSAAGTNAYGAVTTTIANATGALSINQLEGSAGGTVSVDTAGAVTINVSADAKSKATAVDNSQTAFTATDTTNLTLNVSGYTEQTGIVTAAKATSVTINTGDADQSGLDVRTAKATTLDITAGADATFDNTSDVDTVKVLTIDSTGATTLTPTDAMDALQSAVLSGAGADAAVTLGNLGASTLESNVTVTATGLKSGVTIGTVDTASAAQVDFSGATGANKAGNITSTGKATVKAGTGNFTVGTIDASAVVLDTSGTDAASTYTIGNITSGSTVDITANAVTTMGTITIIGDKTSLTVNTTGSLGNDDYVLTNSTAKGFTGFTMSGDLGLGTNTVDITIADATAVSTETPAQTVDVSGMKNATITLDSNDLTQANGLTVIGSTDTDTTEEFQFAASEVLDDASFTNVDEMVLDTALTLNSDAVSGETIAWDGGNTLTLAGSAAADTIDASNFTTQSGGSAIDLAINGGAKGDTIKGSDLVDVITGGTGADTMTGNDGADTFVIAAGDNGVTAATADTITDYTTGTDKIDFDAAMTIEAGGSVAAAGTALIGATGIATFNASDDTMAEKLAAIINVTNSDGDAAVFAHAGTNYLFVDGDGNATLDAGADVLIALTDVTIATGITLDGSGDITAIA